VAAVAEWPRLTHTDSDDDVSDQITSS